MRTRRWHRWFLIVHRPDRGRRTRHRIPFAPQPRGGAGLSHQRLQRAGDAGRPRKRDSRRLFQFFKRASFFKFRRVVIAGAKTNLYDYENKVIRPLDEPRVHFALNCMVRDCPQLPREPFSADTLDQQLDSASWEFFNKDKHLRIDQQGKRIWVSAILDFYTEDFVSSGKPGDLPRYINRYRKTPLPDGYSVRFMDYDWTINQQNGR